MIIIIINIFYDYINIYIYSHDNPGYLSAMLCLWSQARPWELHPVAISGGLVPNFTTKLLVLSFKLQGECHSATMGFAILMINKSIDNHPLKKFGDEDQEMVAILVEARGPKQHELWRFQK